MLVKSLNTSEGLMKEVSYRKYSGVVFVNPVFNAKGTLWVRFSKLSGDFNSQNSYRNVINRFDLSW